MVIAIDVFKENVFLEGDLRINFIATDYRGKIYAISEGCIFLYSVKDLKVSSGIFFFLKYSLKNYRV